MCNLSYLLMWFKFCSILVAPVVHASFEETNVVSSQPEVAVVIPESAVDDKTLCSVQMDVVDTYESRSDQRHSAGSMLHRQGGMYQHSTDHNGESCLPFALQCLIFCCSW